MEPIFILKKKKTTKKQQPKNKQTNKQTKKKKKKKKHTQKKKQKQNKTKQHLLQLSEEIILCSQGTTTCQAEDACNIIRRYSIILSVLGPYLTDGRNSDAKITENMLKSNAENVVDWFYEGVSS